MSILSLCQPSSFGTRQVHIIDTGFQSDVRGSSTCMPNVGIRDARVVFDEIGTQKSYFMECNDRMYAQHGHCEEVLTPFAKCFE